MRNAIFKIMLLLSVSAMLLSSCGGNAGKKDKEKYLPSITGNAGEVLVVMAKKYWEGEPGLVAREVFAAEYPFLPQRESTFKLMNTVPSSLSGAFSLHRNIVIVNISEEVDSVGIKVGRNAWAKPQCVVTLSATSEEEAIRMMRDNAEFLVNAVEQAERDRIIANSIRYEDPTIREAVTANIGGSPYFPKGFTMKKNDGDFMWISQETTHVNQGILIFKVPYTDASQLEADNLRNTVSELWKANVPGMFENTYMTFNKLIEPGVKNISYKNRNIVEMRGLWEVENDYMGGPFVCHIFPDENRSNIVIITAFVYAPKYDKRKYLRQVESIIYSFL